MDTQLQQELVDDLMEFYVEWREHCEAVRNAYAHWSSVSSGGKGSAFADYQFALDCEERASTVYADRVGAVARELARARHRDRRRDAIAWAR